MITDHSNMSENVDSDFKHNRNEKKKIYSGIKEKSIKKKYYFFLFLTGFEPVTSWFLLKSVL